MTVYEHTINLHNINKANHRWSIQQIYTQPHTMQHLHLNNEKKKLEKKSLIHRIYIVLIDTNEELYTL